MDDSLLWYGSWSHWNLVNLNPRMYWHDNCELSLKSVEIEDQLYHDIVMNSSVAQSIVNQISDFPSSSNGFQGIYSLDEPMQGQWEAYKVIQDAMPAGLEFMTASYDKHYRKFPMVADSVYTVGPNTEYYDNIKSFTQITAPNIIMPDIYPFRPDNASVNLNDEEGFQKVLDDKLIKVYDAAKKYASGDGSRLFYPVVQSFGHSKNISQEAIHLLLASKNYINDVYTWLKQLTQNLLCKHYRSILKQKELYDSLCRESELVRKLMCSQSTIQIEGLDPILKKEILTTKEYKEFEAIASFKKISDYATHLNVSSAVAQKRKDKIVKNLRSRLLLAMGWEAGRDILNYNQYNAILKFIRSIQMIGDSSDIRGTSSNSLAQKDEIQKVMQGITSIDDWGITMIGNRRFRFHIFHLTPERKPIISTFIISLNERNHVSIDSCKRDEIVGIHPIPANVRIPKEMGRSLWSYEKIISLLK